LVRIETPVAHHFKLQLAFPTVKAIHKSLRTDFPTTISNPPSFALIVVSQSVLYYFRMHCKDG
ncbi:hypothetical protein T01_12738, partial [Trichinella spiralis]